MPDRELLAGLDGAGEAEDTDVLADAVVPADLHGAVEAVLRWRRQRDRFALQARVASP